MLQLGRIMAQVENQTVFIIIDGYAFIKKGTWSKVQVSSSFVWSHSSWSFSPSRHLPHQQEDDGLRMRKSTVMSAQHSPPAMRVKEEGLSSRVIALIVLFFVVGVIVGKLAL